MSSKEKSPYFPDNFYRVSIRGMCVRDGKLLLMHEQNENLDYWELPGGGLDFGEEQHDCLRREVSEEMGLVLTSISENPIYSWTSKLTQNKEIGWFYSCLIAYEIEFENLDFKPSEECRELKFFDRGELIDLKKSGQIRELHNIFDPKDFV